MKKEQTIKHPRPPRSKAKTSQIRPRAARAGESAARPIRDYALAREQAALVQLVHGALLVRDMKSRVLFWNRGAEALYGWTSAEATGCTTHDLLKTRFPRPLAEIERSIEQRGRWEGELIHTTKDGREVIVDSRWALQRDAAGQPYAILETNIEITDRKRAEDEVRLLNQELEMRVAARTAELAAANAQLERQIAERRQTQEALAASELRFRSLFESMTEGFALHEIICDADGKPTDYRFLEINPAFERFTGLERADVVGKTFTQVLPGEDRHWVQVYGGVALTGQPVRLERYSPALNRHYQVFAFSPAPRQFAVLFLDITERKQAEERQALMNQELEVQTEELQTMNVQMEEALSHEQAARAEAEEGRQILQALMENAPEGILITDAPHGKVRMVSRYGQELTGYPASELIGIPGPNHFIRQGLFAPDGVTPFDFDKLPLRRAMLNGDVVADEEIVLRQPSGNKLNILVSAAPIRSRTGQILGGILTFRDITTRKLTEERVEKLNRDMEQRALELEIANKELESFSYSVSHDLRTPLAGINGFATLLLREYDRQLPPDAKRFIELIRSNSVELNQLVEGLLTFSRYVRQPVKKQTVDMVGLVQQVWQDQGAQRGDRRVEFVVGTLPPAQADPLLLKQVWVNLISNAVKFTRARDAARIEISSSMGDGGEVWYAIRDNGVGFDNDQANRLFGVFQRLHRQEDYEGTGVGLAIVERIVHRHGGRVRAEGEANRGAAFSFTLGN